MLRRFATSIFPAFSLSFVAIASMVGFPVFACVNPKTDYDDFVARTADSVPPVPTEDAAIDNASPESGFTGQYVMACVSQVSDSDPKDATYFQVMATFKPAASGVGGSFDFSDQALPLGPGSPPAPPTSTAGGIGPIVTVLGSAVTADGRCDVVFGPTVVPGAADAVVVGSDIDFTDSTLHFVIGPASHLCAELSGTVTSPLNVTLVAALNICALTPTTGPVEPLTQADVHCP
jgi:hypothetical protein